MENITTHRISAIVLSERRLEKIIEELKKIVAHHDLSVQGTPTQLDDEYGSKYIKPDLIQQSEDAPKKEVFLEDDYGWVLGFSFAIPLFLSIIIAVFLIGDIRSTHDNILFAILGTIVGGGLGALCYSLVNKHHLKRLQAQEKKGGFVLWVTVTSDSQQDKVLAVLKKFRATQLKIE